ncbi:MAG: type I-U CRISPR-associated helicase/endonuclease Cas3, partial [Novipirellula sp. JB048]
MYQPSFSEFFTELYGHSPYPWQTRLVDEIEAQGRWPSFLQLPTGSGKTSVLDIAVYLLAKQANLPAEQRTAPTRIFFVIDRRIVVDEADQKAQSMARQLQAAASDSSNPALHWAARCLLNIAARDQRRSDLTPLDVHTMRGGFYRTNDWAGSLVQPTIITSTVDQVGSRMLFRGYGISPAARPLQAALVATDSLIILDEAHTATPMGETADTVAKYQRRHALSNDPFQLRPMQLVQMTATLPPDQYRDESSVFSLIPADIADSQSVLARRYQTPKPVSLTVASNAKGKAAEEKLAKILCKEVEELLSDQTIPDPPAVAIVVNRVKTARLLYDLLSQSKRTSGAERHLMIGRMRPVDRDQIAKRLRATLATGADVERDRPILVVATQCIEVGADLDFDCMISEAASLDALRQRFGRLNRGGREIQARGQIVIRADQALSDEQLKKLKLPSDADPVYGCAIARTYQWLEQLASRSENGTVDFGASEMDANWKRLSDDDVRRQAMLIGQPETSTLLPAHLDLLTQTYVHYTASGGMQANGQPNEPPQLKAQTVQPDPDVGVFLHGRQQRNTDVQICWRADLCKLVEFDGEVTLRRLNDTEAEITAVSETPPTSTECMTISLATAKAFLSGSYDTPAQADIASIDAKPHETGEIASYRRPILWRGPDDSMLCAHTREIRPGDTLVLPVSAGGWSRLGHVPDANFDPAIERVDVQNEDSLKSIVAIDVADMASVAAAWKPRFRLHPLNAKTLGFETRLSETEQSESVLSDAEAVDLADGLQSKLDGTAQRMVKCLLNIDQNPNDRRSLVVETRSGDRGWIFSMTPGRLRRSEVDMIFQQGVSPPALIDFEDSTSSASQCPVLLRAHLARVERRATEIAGALGLPEPLIQSIGLAGRFHDLGKADPRFQAMLCGGSVREAWLRPMLLAKSKTAATSSMQRQRDLERASLPRNFRHELLSTDLATKASLATESLALHLIASHHGHARPWMPPCDDPAPPPVSLVGLGIDFELDDRGEAADADLRLTIAERFWQCQRKFGWWGTALLESVLRIADQQVSREESEDNERASEAEIELAKKSLIDEALAQPSLQCDSEIQTLTLTGLDGSNPLGMLATLGCFHVLSQHTVFEDLKLSWNLHRGAWRPVLTTRSHELQPETIVSVIAQYLGDSIHPTFNALNERRPEDPKSGKLTPSADQFANVAKTQLQTFLRESSESRLSLDLVAALGNECSRKQFP